MFDTQGLVLLLSISREKRATGVHIGVVAKALVYEFMDPSSILAPFIDFFYFPYTREIFQVGSGFRVSNATHWNSRVRASDF